MDETTLRELAVECRASAQLLRSGLEFKHDAAFFDMLAAVLERVEALTWRPIETAPRSHLLPWESPQYPIIVATSEGRVFESRCCFPTPSVANLRSGEKATHWMPLPAAPTAAHPDRERSEHGD